MIFVFIFILAFFLLFAAILSASETAMFSLSTFTLRSYRFDRDNRKKLISRLLDKPRELLVTLLILDVLSDLLVQNTVSSIFGAHSGWLLKVGVPLFLCLFFGEIIPKSLAISNNKNISYKVAPFIAFVSRVIAPVRIVTTKVTEYVSRVMFFFLKKDSLLSTDELYHMIDSSKKSGVLNRDEVELASGYLDLQESVVREIMRPKDEIIFYNIDDPISKLIDLFVDLKCTRVPVYRGNVDNILGIISVTSFFANKANLNTSEKLIEILAKPFYIPESTKGWSLLSKLRLNREQIAIVVNEYGSTAGLIAQEDLMETVIGEIQDLRDSELLYTRPSDDVIIADGKMEISDIEDIFNSEFDRTTIAVTIGGWLTDRLEKIPEAGDKYTTPGFLFYVLEADPQKLNKVYVRRLKGKNE